MNCFKCNRDVTNAKDTAKCADCGSYYHVACCRIRSLAKLSSMSARTLAAWKCDDCAQDTSSQTSHKSDSDEPKIADILLSIQRDIAVSQRSNKDSFNAIDNKLSTMQSSLDTLNQKISMIEAENASLRAECAELRSENELFKKQVCDLELSMSESQQYSRINNLEIKGIPTTRNENVYDILQSVSKALGLTFDERSISVAHRLPAPRGKDFPPSIVVQFVSRRVKSEWKSASKNKRIQTTDLTPSLRPAPILIVDHLTPSNKLLLGRAKALVKEGRLAFAWVRDGRIMARKTAGSAARRIRNIGELEDIASAGTETHGK